MWYVLVLTSHAEVPSLKKAGRVRVRCMEGDVLCTCLCFPAPGYPFRILAFAACGGAPRHQHQALVAQHAHPGTLQALPECHLDCTGAWILVLSQPLSSKDWFGRFDARGSQCSRTRLAVLVSFASPSFSEWCRCLRLVVGTMFESQVARDMCWPQAAGNPMTLDTMCRQGT